MFLAPTIEVSEDVVADEITTGDPVRVALAMGYPWRPQYAKGLRLLAQNDDLDAQILYWTVDLQHKDRDFGRTVQWDGDLLGGYPWSAPPVELSTARRLAWVWRTLHRLNPEVIICCGWATPLARATIVYALLTRRELLLYGDSTLHHRTRGFVRRMARSVLLRLLFRTSAGAIAQGPSNREFYVKYGMPADHLADGVCPVDVDRFSSAVKSADLDGPLRIGFAGKLIPRKAPDDLIRAVAALPHDLQWTLTLVGDGEMWDSLHDLADGLGLQDRVEFRGFANNSEIAEIVATFDIAVTCSHEDNRPVATVEGMAAGAASIVSDVTGLAGPGDIVEDGETALIFPSGDIDALSERIRRLISDPELRSRIQGNGRSRAKIAAPEAWATSVAAAVRAAATRRRPGSASASEVESGAGSSVLHNDALPSVQPER